MRNLLGTLERAAVIALERTASRSWPEPEGSDQARRCFPDTAARAEGCLPGSPARDDGCFPSRGPARQPEVPR